MAIFLCQVSTISRRENHSPVSAAAYISGSTLYDQRQQRMADFAKKSDVISARIHAPDFAPGWVLDRELLWNHIDSLERRCDASTARQVLIAIPRELRNAAERSELVETFVRQRFVNRGFVVDVAIHEAEALDGLPNHHAHLLFTDRPLLRADFSEFESAQPRFSLVKDRTLNNKRGIHELRQEWSAHCNRALEASGAGDRVDHRALWLRRLEAEQLAADAGAAAQVREEAAVQAAVLDRRPEPKLGAFRTRLLRKDQNRSVAQARRAAALPTIQTGGVFWEARGRRQQLERIADDWKLTNSQIRQFEKRERQLIDARGVDEMTRSVMKALDDFFELLFGISDRDRFSVKKRDPWASVVAGRMPDREDELHIKERTRARACESKAATGIELAKTIARDKAIQKKVDSERLGGTRPKPKGQSQ